MHHASTSRMSVDRQTASDWLRKFLIEHAGEDCSFDNLLGRGPGVHARYANEGSELDRLELLITLVDQLSELLGSREAAAHWLFHDEKFRQTVGYAPFDYLEPGEFEALALLHALTAVELRYRNASDDGSCITPFSASFEAERTATRRSQGRHMHRNAPTLRSEPGTGS